MSAMDIQGIQNLLPHRYPFLMVDRILECDDRERIVGVKNLTINEPFFQGHFPGQPVMPAVLQLEAMAQVGGILLNKITGRVQVMYFLAIDKARFRRQLTPGDQMVIEARFLKFRLNMARFAGQITCNGELASEAELMFGAPRESTAES